MAIIRIQAAPSIRCRTIRTIGVISQLPGEKRDLNTGWSTYKRDEMVSNVPKTRGERLQEEYLETALN